MYSNAIGSPLEGSLPLELETPLNGTTASGVLNHGHYKYSKNKWEPPQCGHRPNSFQIFVNVIQDGKSNNKPYPPVLCSVIIIFSFAKAFQAFYVYLTSNGSNNTQIKENPLPKAVNG